MWVGVRRRFAEFHQNLQLSKNQIEDGFGKQLNVRNSLERAYYGPNDQSPHGIVVGSWGKGTAVAPPNDVDVFFDLPAEMMGRINEYQGNKQSALLQEIKNHLSNTFTQTVMRGDGQVVIVGFNTISIEVVPAFRLGDSGVFLMPDTNNGGSWKTVDPASEIAFIESADRAANGNARPMARMLKVWKRFCNVQLKSYQIELLAAQFMKDYTHRAHDFYWYDWFLRDFFDWLCTKTWITLEIPGTGERVSLGDAWLTKAQSARSRALLACTFEYNDDTDSAGREWQKIFGSRIPVIVI